MLDEPVNGLDPMGVQWLRNLLRSQAARGKAVLLSSHLLSELEVVADKIVMLDQGRVVSQGYINDLKNRASSQKHVVMHTSNDAKVAAVLQRKGVAVTQTDEGLLITGIAPEKLAKMIVKNNLALYMIDEKHVSLEEMFMATAAAADANMVPQTPFQPQQQMMPQQSYGQDTMMQGGGQYDGF